MRRRSASPVVDSPLFPYPAPEGLAQEEVEAAAGSGSIEWGPSEPLPPPDCLGFYLPFHFYHVKGSVEQVWGIYLIESGIRGFANWIHERDPDLIDLRSAWCIAQAMVYHHEFYHHQCESLVTRIEVTLGDQPAYRTWVESRFWRGVVSGSCLEEALAEATALLKTRQLMTKLKPAPTREQRRAASAALREYTRRTGKPYSDGLLYLTDDAFREAQLILEHDYRLPGPYDPNTREHRRWAAAPHMIRGLKDVSKRFWYVCDLSGHLLPKGRRPWTAIPLVSRDPTDARSQP
ncbi:hypothetical protein ACFL09_00800 [Planctomycetota bacterium]